MRVPPPMQLRSLFCTHLFVLATVWPASVPGGRAGGFASRAPPCPPCLPAACEGFRPPPPRRPLTHASEQATHPPAQQAARCTRADPRTPSSKSRQPGGTPAESGESLAHRPPTPPHAAARPPSAEHLPTATEQVTAACLKLLATLLASASAPQPAVPAWKAPSSPVPSRGSSCSPS